MASYPTIFSPGGLMGVAAGDPFFTLHREMNRLFDDVLRGGPLSGQGRTQGGGPGGAMLAPHMDVSETDKEVRIRAEMPGVSEKDIEVSLDDDVLTLRAEKRQERREEREGVHVSERSFGTFQRSIRVPFPVKPDQVKANFENGVLTVTLPKALPEQKTRRIQVQGSSPQGGSERGATDMPGKMSEASDQHVSGSQGSSAGQDSGAKAAAMPKKMGKSSDQPASGQGEDASSGLPSPGFKDPVPPGTNSKSGPGSSGPV